MKQTVFDNFITPVTFDSGMSIEQELQHLSDFHRNLQEIMVKGAKHEIEEFDQDGNFIKSKPIGYSRSNSIYGHTKELIKKVNVLKHKVNQYNLRQAS